MNVISRFLFSLLIAVLSGFGCGPAADQEPFTIVMLPDTQFYAQKYPIYFHDQTEWVRQNAEQENIVFVTQVGDIVQNGDAAPGEWKVADEAIAWVEGILERYPGTPAIVSTHIYMSDETKSRTQEEWYRKDIGNSGEAVWNKLIKKNSQIFMVLCGHWSNAGGEWHQVSTNNAGQPVWEILADYQSRENGGNGWLRLITFVPKENQIEFRTYSPSLDQYETDADSQFTLPLDFAERFQPS